MKKTLTFLAFATSLLFISCDDESDIGLSLQNNDDLLKTSLIDTLTLELSSVLYNEKLNTDSTSILLFGNYEESKTGKTNAIAYFELVPENNRGGFPVNTAVYDSAVFQTRHYYNAYKYPSIYGDVSASLEIKLNELSENLENKDYSPLTTLGTETTNLLISPTTTLNPSADSTLSYTLDNTFGQSIFDKYIDSNTFLNNHKGFALSAPDAKSIVGLSSSNTKIVIYFHLSTNPSVPYSANLVLSANTIRFNNITADFTGTDLNAITQNGHSYPATSEVYLKNGVGLGLHVGIPSLGSLIASLKDLSINKAELVFSMTEPFTSYSNSSAEFVSVYQSSSTSILPIQENNVSMPALLDLSRSPLVEADFIAGTYTIPLTTYFQKMVLGEQDMNDFFIFPFGNSSLVNTTILAGTTNPNETLRPRLKIYYTK